MRQAFEQYDTKKDDEMRANAQKTVENYSYEKIGELIKSILENSVSPQKKNVDKDVLQYA